MLVAVPTNYSEKLGSFDASIVEQVFEQIAAECPNACVVLRSTVQPGTTEALADKYGLAQVLYNPEFLREGRSLEDCLRPDRIVLGCSDDALALTYRTLLSEVYQANGEAVPPFVLCKTKEAEAAKLFANAYLATRIAFFNELDSYALGHDLDAQSIVQAVCLDKRIGNHYNNPSFGYGGYCLPKDTKALAKSMRGDEPNELTAAVINANATRKAFLADTLLAQHPHCIGVHRLVAKQGSDNLRNSATLDLVRVLVDLGANVLAYEPLVEDGDLPGIPVTHNLEELFESCDIILANRMADELLPIKDKVFTRDLFNRD